MALMKAEATIEQMRPRSPLVRSKLDDGASRAFCFLNGAADERRADALAAHRGFHAHAFDLRAGCTAPRQTRNESELKDADNFARRFRPRAGD